MSEELKIHSVIDVAGYDGDETPLTFGYRDELARVGWVVETIVNGLITKEDFYRDPEHTDLILTVDYEYPVNSVNGIIDSQKCKITQFREDGQAHEEVYDFTRGLTPRQQMKLFKKRRATIRLFVEAAVLQLLVNTGMTYDDARLTGGEFMVKHNTSLNAYEAAGSSQFVTDVTAGDELWLDNAIGGGLTIRDYIITEMSK